MCLRITWFITCRQSDPDPLLFSKLQLLWVPQHEISDSWIITALGVILTFPRERIIYMSQIWGSFKKFDQKSNPKEVSVTCLATIWLQYGELFFPIPTKIPVSQPYMFHVIFLILCLLLAIDNLPMKRIWLISRSGIYPIIHVCLSISYQLCCKINILSFWVHSNAIPTCVIIMNLSWPPIFTYIITNHASGWPEARYHHPWCQNQYSSFFSTGCSYVFQIQNINLGQPTP